MNGKTISTFVAVPTATPSATEQQYCFNLLHFLCGNRKICVTSATPIIANLTYSASAPILVAAGVYTTDVSIYGTITYTPYYGCMAPCCEQRTETIKAVMSVPITGSSVTITPTSATLNGYAANVPDCCNLTNQVEIDGVFTLESQA